jgi:hypothetical protein
MNHRRPKEQDEVNQKRPRHIVRRAQRQPTAVGQHRPNRQPQIAKVKVTPFVSLRRLLSRGQ